MFLGSCVKEGSVSFDLSRFTGLTKIGDAATVHFQIFLKSSANLNLFRKLKSETSDSLASNASPELRTLLIGVHQVTDAGLLHLKPFKKLHKLKFVSNDSQRLRKGTRCGSLEES